MLENFRSIGRIRIDKRKDWRRKEFADRKEWVRKKLFNRKEWKREKRIKGKNQEVNVGIIKKFIITAWIIITINI